MITLNSVSVLNIILFWNPAFTYAITGSHLCCTDLLSSTHKASSSPPIRAPLPSVKLLPWQSACSSVISGVRRGNVCSIMPVTCSDYCERHSSREKEERGSVFSTSEPSFKSRRGEKSSLPVSKHPHLTSQPGLHRTLNALLSRQLPGPKHRKNCCLFHCWKQ